MRWAPRTSLQRRGAPHGSRGTGEPQPPLPRNRKHEFSEVSTQKRHAENQRDFLAFREALLVHSADITEYLLSTWHCYGFWSTRFSFPQITTHNLVIILLSGRAGSLLQRDPAEPEPTTSRWPRLLGWEDARRGTGWHAPGLEPPAAHPGREAVATVVQFGGESGPALQELLAGKPAVHPTVASICLSKFQLAGGETTFAGQAGLCLLSLMHLPGRFLTCICAHVCSLPL